MSYASLQAALDTHLLAYQSANIAFPGRPFRPTHGTAYLEVALLPDPAKSVLLGAQMPLHHSGTYRITVHDPDRQDALATVAALRRHFYPGLELTFEDQLVHLGVASLGSTVPGSAPSPLKQTSLPLSLQWRSYF
ncbi:DUF4128 domain-containing protein [Sneathiella marina]|uniref:DUF4128 domain-containing protein n=1 Tax=Sneathiella marina TaxID=2950108 RepID=A0ABY4W2I2_9PROT|nr:phage tail terminator-like protein [Sneathiella marina]USG59935.1 DUF4128 domain-containing protein [Sneathiella marina]